MYIHALKHFAILHFQDGNSVSVAPCSWIEVETGEQHGLLAYQSGRLSKSVIKMEDPKGPRAQD